MSSGAFAGGETAPGSPAASRVLENYGAIPLNFEKNAGQITEPAKFFSRAADYTLLLDRDGALIRPAVKSNAANAPAGERHDIRMRLRGTSPSMSLAAEQRQAGVVNYLIGSDPALWHTDVPTFGRIRYRHAYPGIDVLFYGNANRLEYDYVVQPGANPANIAIAIEGAKDAQIDAQGDLRLTSTGADGGEFVHRRPVAYQEINGSRIPVEASYRLNGRVVRFALGHYDRTRPLVIDPVMVYSTLVGGSANAVGSAIAVDTSGSAYVLGTATSGLATTAGALQTANGGYSDVMLVKLNALGTAMVWATYIGGSNGDSGNGIAVDAGGAVYITGTTSSANYPTTAGSFQSAALPGNYAHGFVSKLSPSGNALVYSTYLGSPTGQVTDTPQAIAIDSTGAAYVSGYTQSNDYPTTAGALKPSKPTAGSIPDTFVTKLNAAGSALVYSTFLGGTQGSNANAIAIDASGNAYLTGSTGSNDFPVTPGAPQATFTGPPQSSGGSTNAFIAKLNAGGSALSYSTYLGGGGQYGDSADGIAIDASGNAVVGGRTWSSSFPTTAGAYQTTCAGGSGFVTKINAAGTAWVYSTCFGTSASISALALDSTGAAWFTGSACNIPTTPVQQGTPCIAGYALALFAKLDPTGANLLYSTYWGSRQESGSGVAVDAAGAAYFVGTSYSYINNDFPTTPGALQPQMAPSSITNQTPLAFAVKIDTRQALVATKTFAKVASGLNLPVTMTIGLSNPNAAGATVTGVGFVDAFPTGMAVAPTPNISNTCTGSSFSAAAGATTITLSGATLAASASCTINVDVVLTDMTVNNGLTMTKNNSITLTSNDMGPLSSAVATGSIAPLLAHTQSLQIGSFGPFMVNQTGSLYLALTNPANNNFAVSTLTGITETITLPAGLSVATGTQNNSCGGTLSASVGGTSITLSGVTINGLGACSISLPILATAADTYQVTANGSSFQAGPAAPATAAVTVNAVTAQAPVVHNSFNPTQIAVNGSSTVTLSVTNPNASAGLTGVALLDFFPSGMVAATPSNFQTTCGGTGGVNPTGTAVVVSNFTLAAGASCTATFAVTSAASANYQNFAGAWANESGRGVTAPATLTVGNAPPPPTTYIVTGAANPVGGGTVACTSPVNAGSTTTCAITTNSGYTLSSASSDVCGGTLSASTFTTGAVNAACTVTANFAAAPIAINGACGSANGVASSVAPSANLCSAGTASAVSGSGPWTWSCQGSNGGSNASCAAPIQTYVVTPQAGANGTIHPSVAQTVNAGAPVSFTVSANSGYSAVINASADTCGGTLSSTTYSIAAASKNCTAAVSFTANPVNGVCGAANGVASAVAPSANLCSAGTASAVSGSGPWTWSCQGSNGGSNASCAAPIQTYVVTPQAGANGTIHPSVAQTVNAGAPVSFTVSANSGYSAVINASADTCGGTLSSTTYTIAAASKNCTAAVSFTANPVNGVCGAANGVASAVAPTANLCSAGTASVVTGNGPWSWTCQGANSGSNASCNAPLASTMVRTYSAPAATGTGTITASFTTSDSGCTFSFAPTNPTAFVATSSVSTPDPGYAYPQGLANLSVKGCSPGAGIVVTVTYPQALPAGSVYRKFGPTLGNSTPHWYTFGSVSGNTATLTLTDGGAGDDDLVANGSILDPGGAAVQATPPVVPPTQSAVPAPALSATAIALLGMLLLALGLSNRNRHRNDR